MPGRFPGGVPSKSVSVGSRKRARTRLNEVGDGRPALKHGEDRQSRPYDSEGTDRERLIHRLAYQQLHGEITSPFGLRQRPSALSALEASRNRRKRRYLGRAPGLRNWPPIASTARSPLSRLSPSPPLSEPPGSGLPRHVGTAKIIDAGRGESLLIEYGPSSGTASSPGRTFATTASCGSAPLRWVPPFRRARRGKCVAHYNTRR
jgi:hypothetical protein